VRADAVCGLYLNPPPGTVLVSVNEKTGIQAKSRRHPDIPARPGIPPGPAGMPAADGSASSTAPSPSWPR